MCDIPWRQYEMHENNSILSLCQTGPEQELIKNENFFPFLGTCNHRESHTVSCRKQYFAIGPKQKVCSKLSGYRAVSCWVTRHSWLPRKGNHPEQTIGYLWCNRAGRTHVIWDDQKFWGFIASESWQTGGPSLAGYASNCSTWEAPTQNYSSRITERQRFVYTKTDTGFFAEIYHV